ncbi:hypothetical protein [Leifsonia sp. TF02-11]|uniref:hypothetical protein n=1 Tax=Leifsonia sp. TF02-11 TaxID=2815212 RepID=UPI001AA12411|nr:hypothetical protein [Leifsonia sp. TF02-11]MBO1737652.1 hypothetical protein [Leifsonia sp. TF02-11]
MTNQHIRGTKHDIREERRGARSGDARFGVGDLGAHVDEVTAFAANVAFRGA